MSPSSKSKGPGTILLVLVLLLGVAGGSAWFIHEVLTGKDPTAAGSDSPAGSDSGDAGRPCDPDNLPTVDLGQRPGAGSPPATETPLPPGQLVAPPANGAARVPGGETGTPQEPGAEVLPGTAQEGGSQDATAGQNGNGAPAGETASDPPPNLLLVPGAIEPPPATAREDAVVRPAFIDDIAGFLAQNYWPKGTHPAARRGGITTVSLQWANLRYGAELQGLEGRGSDPGRARHAILNYILNPAAVGRIYGLYSDGFVAALRQAADKRAVGEGVATRSLTAQEKKEMFGIYASYASSLASALERYAADPSMPAKVVAYSQASKTVQDANRVYTESMIAHEEALAGGDKTRINAAMLRMDKEAATYQKRIREREAARDALVTAMSKDRTVRRNADTLIYAAFWAYRRGDNSAAALRSCAKALGDMGDKLNTATRQIQ